MKFKKRISGVIEEIADCGNVDTAPIGKTLDMQPEKLKESELIHKIRKIMIKKMKMSQRK